MGLVSINHPDSNGHATTTEEAFKSVWEPKGWVLSDPAEVHGEAVRAAVADAMPGESPEVVSNLTKQALLDDATPVGDGPVAGQTGGDVVSAPDVNAEQPPPPAAPASPTEVTNPTGEPDVAPSADAEASPAVVSEQAAAASPAPTVRRAR